MSDTMKVCYFGSYAPSYPRHRIIIKGLQSQGVEVTEVTDSSQILLRYPQLARKYLSEKDFDVILVGEASNYVQPLAILLKKITRKPLIFDTYVSLYDTNQDRGVHQNPVLSRLFYNLDKYNCLFSDVVLQDTNQNVEYFHETFHIEKEKFRRLLIGAEDDLFYPQTSLKDNEKVRLDDQKETNITESFKVLFYGTYIPLHGIEYIIQAAKILENENISFQLIGRGQTFPEIQKLYESLHLSNIEFKGMVDYQELPNYIAQSDACLGIFGGTEKSMRVIPTKAYQILAMKKPLITGYSPGALELFENRNNALLCEMANPESLASAILELKEDEKLRTRIADNGFNLFQEKLTPEQIGLEALKIIKSVL
ncbi:MAG: glycosyl transferase family 1 [Methanobacteriales archaeon HGW-Methanobacteriales-1]|jgi:glycosyltransferase involved in cell wall biosynthesis|nr:MAG: glycosyl transferase family 1 [Methanobacteriales archaeon HGW-Methanobacteriales-1]